MKDFGNHMYEKEQYLKSMLEKCEEGTPDHTFFTGRLMEVQQLGSDWWNDFER